MDIAERIAKKLNVRGWQPFLNRFRVSPPTATTAKVLFVGESPHTDEVKSARLPESRCALAGESGKQITKSLGDIVSGGGDELSIGKLVANGSVDWLAIINVAEVPLEASAYWQLVANGKVQVDLCHASPSIADWLKLMHSFSLIRTNPRAKSRHESFVDDVESCISNDFCCRLQNAIGQNTELVVALGDVAQAYCSQYKPKRSVKVMCAPHPSRRSNEAGWIIPDALRSKLRRVANSTN